MASNANEWVLRVDTTAGQRQRSQWLQLKWPGVPPVFTHDWKLALTFASEAEARAFVAKSALLLCPETKADAAKGAPLRPYMEFSALGIRRATASDPVEVEEGAPQPASKKKFKFESRNRAETSATEEAKPNRSDSQQSPEET